jgi:hypothetical protein
VFSCLFLDYVNMFANILLYTGVAPVASGLGLPAEVVPLPVPLSQVDEVPATQVDSSGMFSCCFLDCFVHSWSVR